MVSTSAICEIAQLPRQANSTDGPQALPVDAARPLVRWPPEPSLDNEPRRIMQPWLRMPLSRHPPTLTRAESFDLKPPGKATDGGLVPTSTFGRSLKFTFPKHAILALHLGGDAEGVGGAFKQGKAPYCFSEKFFPDWQYEIRVDALMPNGVSKYVHACSLQ